MIELPTFRVTQGQEATYAYTWTGKDLTGHTGTATLKTALGGADIGTATCTLGALGAVSFTFTAAQTAEFPNVEKVGFFPVGVFQVVITGPTHNETFQGTLAVAGVL